MRFRIYQFFKVIFIYCLIIFLVSVLLPLLTSIMYRPDAKSEISICWVLNTSFSKRPKTEYTFTESILSS